MKMSFQDLSNFLAIADSPSISHAANLLGVRQPSLSESLKKIESAAGVALFYRSRTGIKLTPAGRDFRARARTVMDQLGELSQVFAGQKPMVGHSLIIGCHPSVGQFTLPKAFQILEQELPKLKIDLIHGSSRDIQTKIQKGEIDCGVVINPVPVPDLVIVPLCEDVVSVWSVDEPSERIICDPQLIQTQSILRQWRDAPEQIVPTNSLELIVKLVSAGLGYGVIPQKVVETWGAGLHRHSELPVYTDRVCLVHRPEFARHQVERLVADALKSALMG
ncbi:LysR family transcriptional regulator [Pseudobacteriovorax antillogorgiicola]|uniref:DNA-binding transcriptional regulator, LysR family n=1 Tax=Pseudobacteriovorax antillogorgiicola TaxID=1513793 RepID=A0A1Y6BHY3_9BACT|nr:LysR family transcriptional regulator [Pseudobacteriovorax antillogorgiicola]TCS56222.1 DNA-binding transcriptional LysR family regulator [Pseudobacteriovorax antillogorgiicola]SMF08366.1 DNA-binding transcriptional regulator, LysR family [Pseudobacteriovorax antillogorgiicola]